MSQLLEIVASVALPTPPFRTSSEQRQSMTSLFQGLIGAAHLRSGEIPLLQQRLQLTLSSRYVRVNRIKKQKK
jgi:hypothetical protein